VGHWCPQEEESYFQWRNDFDTLGNQVVDLDYVVMGPLELVLLEPASEARYSREALGAQIVQGDSMGDALQMFHSDVWEQGWDADERVMNRYGKYKVYRYGGDEHLFYEGTFEQLYNKHCKGS
jgi:hypothetical protein